MSSSEHQQLFEIRTSPIHGQGAFAVKQIEKGDRIIEYLGERITRDEANRIYSDELAEMIAESSRILESLGNEPEKEIHNQGIDQNLVLLFKVNENIYIDGGTIHNEARFINHSCEPNCQAVIESERVIIRSLRAIRAGEELTFDYSLEYLEEKDLDGDTNYICHCGSENCRGTMLNIPPEDRFEG